MHAVVLIDAGYLYAASAILFTGRPNRDLIELNPVVAVSMMRGLIPDGDGASFFVFDAAEGRVATAAQQRWVAAGARLRIGPLVNGRQIDVDERLSRSCVGLAWAQHVPRIYLLTGDSDFVPAIRESMAAGARVEVVGIEGINQSRKLGGVASSIRSIHREVVGTFVHPRRPATLI